MQITTTEQWWPTMGIRALEKLEKGETLTSGERAEAEREREARARRQKSRAFIKREEVKLEKSSHKGIYLGHIVNPVQGLETHMLAADWLHMAPGAHTEKRRHTEMLLHVVTGSGYSIIDGQKYEWEPGDSIHIKTGIWNQHFNSGREPANFLTGSAARMIEHMSPHPLVYKGDSFSDVSDDFQPEHPFGLGPQDVALVDNEKWNSSVHKGRKERVEALEARSKEARTITKWNTTKIERSHHKGDFKVALIDPVMGYDVRMVTMAIHQMPQSSHTETHKHEEAIVFIRTGSGYSIVDGERYDWKAGDCMHIQPGAWHQHFNTNAVEVSQHIAILPTPLLEQLSGFPGMEVVEEEGPDGTPEGYEPKLPWEFDYSVNWPERAQIGRLRP